MNLLTLYCIIYGYCKKLVIPFLLDNDYNSGPYNATFTIGNNTATLNIPITKDTIHEGNESFTLTIMKNALPSRVSRGSPSMATVTIVDTTGELIVIPHSSIMLVSYIP